MVELDRRERRELRERKKRRTRDALLVAALELFTTHGYEETAVDEITDAVEVCRRTFFRCFAGKEAAVFAVQDMVESHFLSEPRQRPADEAPFEAKRRAVLCAWDSLARDPRDPRDPRPRAAVAAFSGVMRAAGQLWGQGGDGGMESLRALTETYLDALTPALSERWRTS
ncbi:TetR family transcriptional regulator [Streptomyces sp. NBC_00727]|uniref:TetR family transcriptional regulator n=1 Tax=Streptomyces sp. NBC_00727 TaxID=2903675 RepID=UPI003867B239